MRKFAEAYLRKFSALLFVAACLFIQPAQIEGQSFDSFNTDDFTMLDTYYLGRAVAANILSVYRPYTASPEVTQYLNLICQALVINSNYPPTFNGYHVIILDSDEFNAFASPAGHIFITKRLIETVTSEDMLAAVIAHEIAHVTLRHSIALIKDIRLVNELSAIADWAAGTAARFSNTPGQAGGFRSSVTRTVDALMRNGYSQTQEFEADAQAILLLSRAGYDPRALVELLRVLQRQGPQITGLYLTHPSPALRIANIQRFSYPGITTGEYRTARFRNLRW